MKTRILVVIPLLPALIVFILVLPPIWPAILFGLASALAAYEMMWTTGLVKHVRLVIYSALMAFGVSMWSYFGLHYSAALIAVLAFSGLLFMELLISKATLGFEKIGICLASGLLIPFFLTALVRLRCSEDGRFLIVIPFLLCFLSDSGAYFTGRFLGKRKLAPKISPNKTVEGMIGGILWAVVGMMLYGLILERYFGFTVNYLLCGMYGVLGALTGVFGDLAFSAIKRQTGIKDYGKLIPGHGGVLDRFDSTSLIAPLVEVLVMLLPVAVKTL